MTWGIVFIIVAVAMAVGPIMMFKPDSHTRRLEKLRAEAAQTGLKLRTVNYETRNRSIPVVVYSQLCETPFDMAILERRDFAHDIHFHQSWDWQEGKSASLPDSSVKSLIELLDSLPDSVVGLEFSPQSVGLWWREKNVSRWGVSDLKATLSRLQALLNH